MIQAWQFFNEPVANLSIIVLMAYEMLRHQCTLQHGPTPFSANWSLNSPRIVHKTHPMQKQWQGLCCTVYVTRHIIELK